MHEAPAKPKRSPLSRLLELASHDRRELLAILVYSVLNSLMLLAIPLAAQGLVNVTAAGLPLQPLLVLTGALFIGLLFAGLFTVLRFYLVEVTQERIFCRVALNVSQRLPKVRYRILAQSSGPELMNRFFDVVSIQKAWFKLIFDGPGAVLEVVFGLSLLLLYGFDLFLLALGCTAVGGLFVLAAGFRGLNTSIDESTEKYRVAAWLEEMVRCHQSLRVNSRTGYWLEETDRRVSDYILDRRLHFRVLLRQNILYYLYMAATMAAVLGLGGAMVINGQLTLGQLVAAELVIWGILKATEKMIRLVENFYDLLTGLEKVSAITDLPLSDWEGSVPPSPNGAPAKLRACDLVVRSPEEKSILTDVDFTLEPGERLTILGPSGSGKSLLISVLAGLVRPTSGAVEFDNIDLREVDALMMNPQLGLVSAKQEIFAGTVWDNIALGRPSSLPQVRDLLLKTGGGSLLRELSQGVNTQITSGGVGLSLSQRTSILVSRALLGRPRLLLLDECLGHLPEAERESLSRLIFEAEDRPTIVSTLAFPEMVAASDKLAILKGSGGMDFGATREMCVRTTSPFVDLYPRLAGEVQRLLDGKENRS